MTPARALRSLLFVPGGRADMIAKVGRSAADGVVLDLEDAVAAADKDSARATVVEALTTGTCSDSVAQPNVSPSSGSPCTVISFRPGSGCAATRSSPNLRSIRISVGAHSTLVTAWRSQIS